MVVKAGWARTPEPQRAQMLNVKLEWHRSLVSARDVDHGPAALSPPLNELSLLACEYENPTPAGESR